MISVKGEVKPLSFDHKPQNEGECIVCMSSALTYYGLISAVEKNRIAAAGGYVSFGRVNGASP